MPWGINKLFIALSWPAEKVRNPRSCFLNYFSKWCLNKKCRNVPAAQVTTLYATESKGLFVKCLLFQCLSNMSCLFVFSGKICSFENILKEMSSKIGHKLVGGSLVVTINSNFGKTIHYSFVNSSSQPPIESLPCWSLPIGSLPYTVIPEINTERFSQNSFETHFKLFEDLGWN